MMKSILYTYKPSSVYFFKIYQSSNCRLLLIQTWPQSTPASKATLIYPRSQDTEGSEKLKAAQQAKQYQEITTYRK